MRSRVEVNFVGNAIFNEEVKNSSALLKSDEMIYPLGVSKMFFRKGMMFGLSDFLQISSIGNMQEYWSIDSEMKTSQDFAMTTGWPRSLSSDQALLATYLSKSTCLKPFKDRYHFSLSHWRIFSNYLENSCYFFDEGVWGLSLGRLKRETSVKKFKLNRISPGFFKVKLHPLAMFHFYFSMRRSQVQRFVISLYLFLRILPRYLIKL